MYVHLFYLSLLLNHKIKYLYSYLYFDLHLYQDLESEAAKVLKEVYWEKADTEIAVSASPEVFQKYEVKGNSVVLFKKVWTCYDTNWKEQSEAFYRKSVTRYKK